MANRWYGVTVDCVDPDRMAAFWGVLLDRQSSDEMDGDGWATIGSRNDAQPRITFQRVPERRTGKVRLHLDVQVDDMEAGIAEVERLGGAETAERHEYDEGVVVVMTDPEGHQFCLLQLHDSGANWVFPPSCPSCLSMVVRRCCGPSRPSWPAASGRPGWGTRARRCR
jgi:predicted enzyme related to lactoylglutathione lyase